MRYKADAGGRASGPASGRSSLELQVQRTIRKYGMLEPGDHVLVAVSGGADSVALLCCLHRLAPGWRVTLTVAHLNHGIRGSEAEADEEFVRNLSVDLGLPFVSETVGVREKAVSRKMNLEETARIARYEFLRRTAARVGARKIAVGHSLDDQAETVLLHFLRGSGIDGLSSIHPIVDNFIIRPLLECTRGSILRYLESRHLLHREDSSNRDVRFRRNRLRLEWIPYLQQNFNPRLVETLGRGVDLARELVNYLEIQSRAAYEDIRAALADGIALPAGRMLAMHPAIRRLVVRHALREVRGTLRGITARHIENILGLCRGGCSGKLVQLPCRGVAVREFEKLLLLRKARAAKPGFCYTLPLPGLCAVPEASVEIVASMGRPEDMPVSVEAGSSRALLDADLLPTTLLVRSRLPGDRYGGPGHRKIKKMLIDAKMELAARAAVPVIAVEDAVIWIPGFKPARAFVPRAGSRRYVVLEARKLGGSGK